MRQVDYTGFGWTEVFLDDSHLDLDEGYSFERKLLKRCYLRWLKNHKSGGYFFINRQDRTAVSGGRWSSIIDKSVQFSRSNDAMMFSLQCL